MISSILFSKTRTIYLLIFLCCTKFSFCQSFDFTNLNKRDFCKYYITSNFQDYDGDGDLDIIAGQYAGLYWLENEPTKQFPKHKIITEDIEKIADVDIADIDNDGDLDYVVCMTNLHDGELAWYQRQNDTSYIKWTIKAGKDMIMADLADFNNDGWIDIAAVGLGNNDECRVFFNKGDLFFADSVVATGGCGEAVSAGDVDGDGDIDLAIGGGGVYEEGARIILNDGDGSFSHGYWLSTYGVSSHSIWQDIKIIDLNSDGINDVLGFGSECTGGLRFFDGSQNFTPSVINREGIDTGGGMVFCDIDNNGLMDIIRQEECDGNLLILYQVDTLSFNKEYLETQWDNLGNPVAKMALGDMDNDGDIDLVFPEKGNIDMDIAWYENINGKLIRHYIYTELYQIRIIKAIDIDKDSDMDIVGTLAGEDEVILFENIDGTNFINWRICENLDYAADIEPADIDNDGDIDIVVTARDNNAVYWLENPGFNYNWDIHLIDDNANEALGCAVGYINEDNAIDIAVCCFGDAKVFWYQNDGDGNFGKKVASAQLSQPRDLEIADFNGDADQDLAIVSADSNYTATVLINESNSFNQQVIYTGKTAFDIEVGDWNNDNTQDIFISISKEGWDSFSIISFINNGNANFEYKPVFKTERDALGIKLGDVDNDDDLDIIFSEEYYPLYIGFNKNDTITFNRLTENSSYSICGIDIADFNSDDKMDIVYADYNKGDLNILFANYMIPEADFIADTTKGVVPLTINFTDQSTGDISDWLWSFGDGSTSTEQNPNHTYVSAGVYSVSLIAIGAGGSDTIVINDLIEASTQVGIESISKNDYLQIYPNPSACCFNIKVENNTILNVKYEVFNSTGRCIQSETLKTNNWVINMQGENKGFYLIKIFFDDKVISKTLVLK